MNQFERLLIQILSILSYKVHILTYIIKSKISVLKLKKLNIEAYKEIPIDKIPDTESLKDTYERVLEFYKQEIYLRWRPKLEIVSLKIKDLIDFSPRIYAK